VPQQFKGIPGPGGKSVQNPYKIRPLANAKLVSVLAGRVPRALLQFALKIGAWRFSRVLVFGVRLLPIHYPTVTHPKKRFQPDPFLPSCVPCSNWKKLEIHFGQLVQANRFGFPSVVGYFRISLFSGLGDLCLAVGPWGLTGLANYRFSAIFMGYSGGMNTPGVYSVD
jgi:hypothetical protein